MKKTNLPSQITLLILTMITTVMWVGFSIYRAFTQAPAPSVPNEISATLNPSLDMNTINKVESALFFNPSQIPTFASTAPAQSPTPIATPRVTPTPTATPASTASSSATPTASPR